VGSKLEDGILIDDRDEAEAEDAPSHRQT
jgi:hypothetical protein